VSTNPFAADDDGTRFDITEIDTFVGLPPEERAAKEAEREELFAQLRERMNRPSGW
jgi:hypothetical protein